MPQTALMLKIPLILKLYGYTSIFCDYNMHIDTEIVHVILVLIHWYWKVFFKNIWQNKENRNKQILSKEYIF